MENEIIDQFFNKLIEFEFLGGEVVTMLPAEDGSIDVLCQLGRKRMWINTDSKGRCYRLGEDDKVVKFRALLPKGEYCGNI